MSDMVEMTDPVEQSVGGIGGHVFRRSFHLSMVVLPLVYYWHGHSLSEMINLSRDQLTALLVMGVLLAEFIRLKLGITIIGQRRYESEQISALAWGALSIGLACLIAPHVGQNEAAYGMPLILCLVLGDPALGESRRLGHSGRTAFIIGSLVCAGIWVGCWHWLDTPLWMAAIMAPLTVAAEWPRLRWIDDNATMILIPLAAVILLHPFTGM